MGSSDSEDEILSTIQEMDSESIGSSISQQHHDDNNNNSKPSDRISPGSTVEFRDLSEESSRQFNGTRGTVEAYHDDIQRYTVRCHDDDHKVIIVKRNNLSLVSSSSSDSNNNNTKEVKKKKKKSSKHHHQRDHDNQSHVLEASQQILVDLCNEMKSLQSSIITSTTESTSVMQNNIHSNTTLLHQIQTEVNLLQSNLRQLDNTIQHRATPEQISEMGKIRAIQNLLADAQADKNTTVQLYEMHARRGYEEIERLHVDLEVERKENTRLREEVDVLRNNYAAVSGGVVGGIVPGPTGPLSPIKGGYGIPDAYVNGSNDNNNAKGEDGGETIGTFDDMTLESKQTNDNTVAYETKSLKKRIIHMKKKLAVVTLEAKEADGLRCELERMRVAMESMKKENVEKDKTIQRLKEDIANLKRGYSGVGAPSSTGAATTAASSVTKKKSGNRWWNNASS
eukprot:scaffold22383_cov37-Cyclotella_meneghiniana.AAC.2